MNKRLIGSIVVSALIFWLVFQLLAFAGLGFVAFLALVAVGGYLVWKRTTVVPALKRRVSRLAAPRPPRPPRPSRQQRRMFTDKPLSWQESRTFDDIARNFDEDSGQSL